MIKNIILTSAGKDLNLKGILNLETTTTKTLVGLKTYNFSKTLGKFLLGLKCGDELFKVELSNGENYIIDKALDLNQKISAVVVKIEDNKSDILIWGSNETNKVWQNSFIYDFDGSKKEEIEKQNEIKREEKTSQNEYVNIKSFDDEDFSIKTFSDKENNIEDYETDEEIDSIVEKSMNMFSEELEEENKSQEKSDKSEFLASVEEQINELLNNYDEEKALEDIIPNSKFVKVNSSGENFYIFGVIYENSEIKYIVYGIPGEYSVKPDDEYSKFYQWLPLSPENPQGYGYYLMYQDALNGSQVEVVLE